MKIYDSSHVNFELPPTLKVEHTICLFSLSPLKLGLGHIVSYIQSPAIHLLRKILSTFPPQIVLAPRKN